MCRNQRTLHTCMHSTTLLTLCEPTLAPLVHRATTFPYSGALPSVKPFAGCDVVLSTEQGKRVCPDCTAATFAQGELDIWHLDDDHVSGAEQKAARPRTDRVFVEVDLALRPPAKNPLGSLRKKGPSRDLQPEVSERIAKDVITAVQRDDAKIGKSHGAGHCSRQPLNKINVTIAAKPCMTYTNGLGLLVTPKRLTKSSHRLGTQRSGGSLVEESGSDNGVGDMEETDVEKAERMKSIETRRSKL